MGTFRWRRAAVGANRCSMRATRRRSTCACRVRTGPGERCRKRAAPGRPRKSAAASRREAPLDPRPSRLWRASSLGIWGVIAVAGIIAYHAAQLPPIDQLAVPKRPPNIAILAADGTLLANRGETGGRTVAIKELPPYLPKAFVAIEDRRFYDHLGVDPVGIARALMRNLTSRGVAQGGSTLTQQLAKNLFLTQERTASRKIQEAILALLARAQLRQGPDPRALPQPGLFRRRRLRRRGGGAALFRQAGPRGDARRGGGARRPRAGAVAARPEPQPRGRPGPRRPRSRRDGASSASSARRSSRRRSPIPAKAVRPQGAGTGELRRRLGHGRARRLRRRGRHRHRRHDDDRAGAARRRRARPRRRA